MRRKRRGEHVHRTSLNANALIWKMCLLLRWWIPVLFLTDLPSSSAIQVSSREDRKYATLFQSVVLPCQYSSMSTQTPVVQWWYKSYCRDRTRDAFSFPEGLGVRGSSSHLDCSDSSRTVRVVASVTGSSITLAEHYKGRDITIINKADLRIGELQWGDSGVYLCKVIISDDLEGRNEAPVELLVLGKTGTGVSDDLLPDFDVKIMPEWAFVGSVALGIILFILLFGVCWCQCCPHSCCCYVSCWCCPETCCCPRHLYEAGKGLRSRASSPQIAVYPPYYVPGVPAMVPIAPPSLVDTTMMSAPPSVSEHSAAGACSISELSSLHEVDAGGFRQSYRQIQKKALPAIPDHDRDLEDIPDLHHPSSSSQPRRSTRYQHRRNRSIEEDHHHDNNSRWNPRSEHLQRKAFLLGGKSGSLDELEEFSQCYRQRGPREELTVRDIRDNDQEYERLELREREGDRDRDRDREYCPPSYRDKTTKRGYRDNRDRDDRVETWRERDRQEDCHGDRQGNRQRSPPPSPKKRRGTWDNELEQRPPKPPAPPPPPRQSPRGRDYDDELLSTLLERKTRRGGASDSGGDRGRGGGRGEEDTPSDTPSKGSKGSKKSSGSGGERHHSRCPSNREVELVLDSRGEDSLPPYCQTALERFRAAERPSPSPRPSTHSSRPSNGGSTHSHADTLQQESGEERDKPRKVSTLLSRDSLIV
ncbi:immunoglobulin-like domain-containing receptor 2 isoform X4 [Oncorhynchus kisutch]|uniref:Immunoglobulin-like domain-containing receptor 2 n=1 Tax=Oncorhynchus kisutch TaxID=8019 RepID=A0A8C7LGT0_ONCKI|nr:immunoglobulin-like domain-containing receptor 2 isoform X4 [Oncorhynchus kisutch]XP_031674256.1 immunoglobulin-like domain-containing receptor 2 isoform X4 [Oncorhynchus kisutch]